MGDSMDNKKDFEDIVSDSSLKKEEYIDLSSMSKNYKSRHFKKKKLGLAAKISKWWKKAGKLQKATVIIVSITLVAVISAAVFIASYFDYNYNKITGNAEDLGFEEVIDKNVMNIALFGIDSRNLNSFKGNSDSIMILSLNMDTKQVKIVSIMRDSLVKIDRKGKTTYNKINSAYAYGGPELAIKTINENFGLDISEYATVNFEGMKDIIDAVGGIDAELTSSEVASVETNAYALNGVIYEMCTIMGTDPDNYYITQSGKHHLNGIQAVAYSRIRKVKNIWGTNNDHGRTDRQRYVMEQLFDKALALNKASYIKLAKAMIPCTETSLSYSDIMDIAFDILLHSPTFSQSRVPLDDYQMSTPTISGVGSCVYYDLEYASKVLHAYFYDDITPEEYIEQNGVEKNNWYSLKSSGSSNKTSSTSSVASSQETVPETPSQTEPEVETPAQESETVSETEGSNEN